MITFRFARASDIDSLMEMWEALMLYHVKHLRSQPQSDFAKDYLKIERKHMGKILIPSHHLIVAEDVGRPIGYVEFVPETRPAIFSQRKVMSITSIYIKTDYRRRGVGERLIEQVARIAKTKKIGRLMVRADVQNATGIKFYADSGFEKHRLTLIRKIK